MTVPALVLVHGGAHAADCWDLTIDEIHRLATDLNVFAVDLPGRGGKPADLSAVTIKDCVESVIADIEDAGLDDVVVCGHSLGGVTVPGVVAKLGASRVREMILAAAFLPPEATSVLDSLGGPLGWYARRAAGVRRTVVMPRIAASRSTSSPRRSTAVSFPTTSHGRGYSQAGIGRYRDGNSAGASRLCPVLAQ